MSNKTVQGTVQAVGDKFTGSLCIDDTWYSNAKGFKNPAQKGNTVTLTLAPWSSGTKSGFNIVDVIVHKAKQVEAQKEEEHDKPASAAKATVGRDFDSENRGKVRHGLMVALVPLVAQELITEEKAKKLVVSLTDFVMKG